MNLNLVFAPKDVNFVPTEDAASEVYDFMLEEVQDHVEFIEVDVAPRLVYIDEGDSFMAAVACPICKSKISTQGPHAAWVQALRQELMSNQALDLGVHRVRLWWRSTLVVKQASHGFAFSWKAQTSRSRRASCCAGPKKSWVVSS